MTSATTRPSDGKSATPSRGIKDKIKAAFAEPQLNYKAIVGITLILTIIGLTMVLSSSMVSSRSSESSVWSVFIRQVVFAVVGLGFAWGALRMRSESIKRMAPWLLGIAMVLQFALLIPGVGVGEEIGSHSWIRIGSIGIQPSELAKAALAVWGSVEVSKRIRQTPHLWRGLGTFLIVAGVMMGLVLYQMDLGMMLTVGIVLMALIYFSGVSRKLMLGVIGIVGLVAAAATVTQSYRNDRISTWFDALFLKFREGTTQGSSYQTYQGLLSLSDGSLFGTGLGQSRAKWFYLPEAKNDFIFAIIGEELGWIGAIVIVILFAALGYFGIKTSLSQADPFLSLLSVTLTLGVVVQAFYNISYVLGLAPMTGIQLPLISAGGTSMVITLGSLGLLANCARHEPSAISSMQHEGRSLFDRMLMLPEPVPYRSGESRRIERREVTRRYGEPVTRRKSTAGTAGQDVRREHDRVRSAQRRLRSRDLPPDYDGSEPWHRREPLPPRTRESKNYPRSPRR